MQIKDERLREKGWSEEEIKHTHNIVNKIKRSRKKHPHNNILGEATYWFLVGATIASIIAIAYWILPLVLFLPPQVLYPMIIIIGLSFGMLLWIIVKDLDHLERKHHTLISVIIPLTGVLSFTFVLRAHQMLANKIGNEINITLTTIIFILAYATPYAYHLHDKSKNKKKK